MGRGQHAFYSTAAKTTVTAHILPRPNDVCIENRCRKKDKGEVILVYLLFVHVLCVKTANRDDALTGNELPVGLGNNGRRKDGVRV